MSRFAFGKWGSVTSLLLALAGSAASAATITVNSTADTAADDGLCTFREAIIAANGNAASGVNAGECLAGQAAPIRDVIVFNIAGGGVHTIQPGSALPSLTEVVHINGYSQAGAAVNTDSDFGQTNATLVIEIDGTNAGEVPGLTVSSGASGTSGTEAIIEGLVINRFDTAACCADSGILVNSGVHDLIVRGNFIGTNAAGTTSAGYGNGARGIALFLGLSASDMNVIVGGAGIADRNVIAGNAFQGVLVSQGRGVEVIGNIIGSDATGAADLGNGQSGVHLEYSVDCRVEQNLVSGNSHMGVYVRGSATDSVITANRIGTDAGGTNPLGNSLQGILLGPDNNSNAPSATLISYNLIAYNGNDGVAVNGDNSTGARITSNSFAFNGGLGIDLADDGVTLNDSNDPDTGPNALQNFPVITSASGNGASISLSATFDSVASTDYALEFYHSASCDPTGYGEGVTYLGVEGVTTDGSGAATVSTSLASAQTSGYVTALAINGGSGDTSEFSACFALAQAGNPGTVQLASASYSVGESDGTVTLLATRSGGSSGAASVLFTTAPGSAVAVADYTPSSGPLTWSDGDSAAKQIVVPITNDATPEPSQTFTVVLSIATGASLGSPATAVVTILDDDLAAGEPIPAAGKIGLAALGLMLAALGAVALRRGLG